MIKRLLVTILALTLSVTHAFAQQLTSKSIDEEVARAAAAQSRRPVRDKNPYETPGIVLIGAGAGMLLLGFLTPTGVNCEDRGTDLPQISCSTTHNRFMLLGGTGLASVGGYLLLKGQQQQNSRAPRLIVGDRKVAVRARIRW